MTLSQELIWRGFVNQTTYKDITVLDEKPITFYLGVDPSADSMTIGNLAIMMMVRHFVDHGHKAVLLVGGATGLIGDPDGKAQEREQLSLETVANNKHKLSVQYKQVLAGQAFKLVDNYEWFKDMGYLQFLREVGKHVPMRQMLGRDFVQSRLGEDGAGISYAEFSYSLIQGYDFLHLFRESGVTLQICGADQWGNSIAGVELIRRIEGQEANIWSAPLIVNKTTGVKFGKSEAGAIWLDPTKTSPTQFYQFWINCDDAGVEDYLKIYTLLTKDEIEQIMRGQTDNPGQRLAQQKLAQEVTRLVHGETALKIAKQNTDILIGGVKAQSANFDDIPTIMKELAKEVPYSAAKPGDSITEALVSTGLATSNTDARRLLGSNAISINWQKVQRGVFEAEDFQQGYALIRRGKAYKDTALIKQSDL